MASLLAIALTGWRRRLSLALHATIACASAIGFAASFRSTLRIVRVPTGEVLWEPPADDVARLCLLGGVFVAALVAALRPSSRVALGCAAAMTTVAALCVVAAVCRQAQGPEHGFFHFPSEVATTATVPTWSYYVLPVAVATCIVGGPASLLTHVWLRRREHAIARDVEALA